MFNIILERSDRIETIMPTIAEAMAAGDTCRLQNMAELGRFDGVAEQLRGLVDQLLSDLPAAKVRAGFRLLGVDEYGVTRTLVM